ncbi:Transcription factor tau subunit sfc6 [Hypsizygus marmoreus]|uniref:Transcription factor tau subunit sfc6 n=1 Tax=Hypsizygus marmoreus TaxID=39966 RepID=A0A369JUI7_HYPMA|nr:Transcription factor tau subunit sfc6 [Hypsizygus marmoreus]
MARTLRPRKSKPSYAAMAGLDLDEETGNAPTAGPSKRSVIYDDDADSGSDFAPEKDPDVQEEEAEDEEAEETLEADVDEEDLVEQPRPSIRRSTSTPPVKPKVTVVAKGPPKPSLSRASKRQMYVLPTPSVHHRHRAVPLYTRVGRVERLESRPSLFRPPKITMTNNFTQNAKVTDRVNKSWGYNVGCGPLWEMVEDRGWYKEAAESGPDMDSDASRRPKVYENVNIKGGWEILDKTQAAPYLPTDIVTTEEGNLKPPPPVPCLLGPLTDQTQLEIEMFETHKMADFIPESTSHIFNAGAAVWGIDWCPINASDRSARSFKQYLAVAPFPTSSHSPEIGARVTRPSYACIQIWSLGPSKPPSQRRGDDSGRMKCEIVLCLDGGPAQEVKWCPLPSHYDASSPKRPRKLGLLAGTFEDGSWSLYAVPDPQDVAPPDHDPSQPVFVKLPEPILRIELEETSCWTFDWANSELVAIGTTNGIIAVYDVGSHLKAINSLDFPLINDILPTHYITVHQSAIRALAWIRAPPCTSQGTSWTDADPTVIASGGYDGVECMTDIREGHGSVMNRTRDVINAMAFSPFGGGPVTIDHENIVKAYSASPSMLGRGHTLLEPQGPVWSVSASDLHPQLAVGSADGSCTTTNSLRSTRRGGSVPFFIHKIYQLDYSRKTGVYRMLDRFLPQETQDRPAPKSKSTKAKPTPAKTAVGTGAWPREVGVHRVTWNSSNGLAAAGLLASSTASGLCRVDELWGRWIKGKVPYGGIGHIRKEVDDDAMDVDADGDSEESAGSA